MIILNPQNRQDNRTAQALRESHTSHENHHACILLSVCGSIRQPFIHGTIDSFLMRPKQHHDILLPLLRPSQNHVGHHVGQATRKRPNQQMKTCIRYWLFLYHFSLFLSISYAKRPKWHYTRFTTMPGTFNKWLNHAVHRHQLNYYFP